MADDAEKVRETILEALGRGYNPDHPESVPKHFFADEIRRDLEDDFELKLTPAQISFHLGRLRADGKIQSRRAYRWGYLSKAKTWALPSPFVRVRQPFVEGREGEDG